jgi:phosphate transport system substrate-binding protein
MNQTLPLHGARQYMLRFTILLTGLLMLGAVARAETVTIHGSTTVSNAILVPHKADIEQASGETLDIVGNGSGRGLADLAAGKADIAMISAPLETEVAAANAKTPGSLALDKLVAHKIGEAQVAFLVHPSNPVKELTLAQLTQILSGQVTNWKEVGGSDQPVMVVAAGPGDGVRTVVEKQLLDGASIHAQIREMTNAPQIAQVAAQLPQALGVTSATSLRSGVTVLKTDHAIGQPLMLVTTTSASPQAAKVIAAATAAAH